MQAVQQVVDGLASGSIHAALALAIVLSHRATGVINFAQGEMAVFSAYLAWTFISLGLPVIAGIALAMVVSIPFGALIERTVIRRFERESPLVAIVVTVGLLIFLNGVVGQVWGLVLKPFPAIFPAEVVRLGGVAISVPSLGNIVTLIVVVGLLQLLFLRTRFGLAMRAVAINPDSSALSGLPVGRLLMAGWGLAAALGALAGCLVAPKLYLEPNMMGSILIYSLAAAILGGLDSPLGAVLAAWIIGVAENLAGTYIGIIGNDLKIAIPLLIVCLALVVRPQGLFGQRDVVRV